MALKLRHAAAADKTDQFLFKRAPRADSFKRGLGRILPLAGSECNQGVRRPASCRDQLGYRAQVRRDRRVVLALAQSLQFREQLRNVLLMKDCNCFMANETQAWEVFALEIREEALNERVIISKSLQHPSGRGPRRFGIPVHFFPQHVDRHDAA
jgi:hypothetical protein